jgi:DNA ligase-1
MEILELTKQFIEEINKTNSSVDKKEVLRRYPDMKEMLEVVYNPFKMYNVSSDNCKKNKTLINKKIGTIFDVLEDLRTRRVTGHDAIAVVNGFISLNPQYEDTIYKILDKDLECRIGDKIINDVYPGLIPTFNVALANSYQDVKNKVDLIKEDYYSAKKIDGCRCLCVIDNTGDIKFYSRQGNEFETLGVLRKEIQTMNLKNVVLDGEICIVDDKGVEDFQSIMKLIRKKDFDIPNPKYLVFDQIKYDDFFKEESRTIFTERQEYLRKTLGRYKGAAIEMLKQTKIESMEQFLELSKEAEDNNWEGLIVRKNTIYKGKRSNDLLKVKKMEDAEYKVIDVEFGPFRQINKQTGLEETIETLSNVIIEHKGNRVSVGSGFTFDQRREYYENPELIKDMIITVKYFEETKNKEGLYSLRFPIFKGIQGTERTV